ncbi:MAG TPA: BadF/BadG/BcrA/BcrD ATPase family protein [Bryobacteraceae bacterium]|nr:BadF/BadG/BcrA/BcrD ATPase family protein [Bryobacteraceae bacterium]
MKYFLGVDGGQSTTTAVIGDENGKTIGWATAGPCNHVAADEARAKFLRVMRECISQAAARAGLEPVGDRWPFRAACLGMSGGTADKSALLRELLISDHILITDDPDIALAGALSGEPGIVVISGTGSIAFGRNARGETARVGGWGYIYGDEGSGFDIAREGLRAVMREYENWGGHTTLTPAYLNATGAADPFELLHLFYTPEWPRARVAQLAKLVDRAAEEGDPVALGILHQAARQLAMQAQSVRRRLFADGEPARSSWAGGVFESPILLDRFRELLSLEGECAPPRHGPAIGALLLAYRAAGMSVSLYSPA